MFLDVAPIGGGTGLLAGGAFLLVFAGIAFIVFKMLKRTVKMAFRVAIVAVILTIAVAGSVALWAFGSGISRPPARPTRSR